MANEIFRVTGSYRSDVWVFYDDNTYLYYRHPGDSEPLKRGWKIVEDGLIERFGLNEDIIFMNSTFSQDGAVHLAYEAYIAKLITEEA